MFGGGGGGGGGGNEPTRGKVIQTAPKIRGALEAVSVGSHHRHFLNPCEKSTLQNNYTLCENVCLHHPLTTRLHSLHSAAPTCTVYILLHRPAQFTFCCTDLHSLHSAAPTCTVYILLHRPAQFTFCCTDLHSLHSAAPTCPTLVYMLI